MKSRRAVLLVIGLFVFSALPSFGEEPPPEDLVFGIPESSVPAGKVVTMVLEVSSLLLLRLEGAPIMATLERLENRETGAPASLESADAVWRPVPGTTRVVEDGRTEFSVDTAEFPPGTYVFRVSGGPPTEPLTSMANFLVVTEP